MKLMYINKKQNSAIDFLSKAWYEKNIQSKFLYKEFDKSMSRNCQ